MRNWIMAGCLLALTGAARAQQTGALGLGVILGNPTGVTAKYWTSGTFAVDAAAGFSEGDAAFYADALWHAWDLLPKPPKGRLGGYVGLGPRVGTENDGELALRTLAGADYWIEGHPIEFFAEVGPIFRVTPDQGVDIDGGIGVRFYFGPVKPRG